MKRNKILSVVFVVGIALVLIIFSISKYNKIPINSGGLNFNSCHNIEKKVFLVRSIQIRTNTKIIGKSENECNANHFSGCKQMVDSCRQFMRNKKLENITQSIYEQPVMREFIEIVIEKIHHPH